MIITAQWEGMGDVGSARYEPALLPPWPTIRVLSYSKCQRSTHSISKWIFRNLVLLRVKDREMFSIPTGSLLKNSADVRYKQFSCTLSREKKYVAEGSSVHVVLVNQIWWRNIKHFIKFGQETDKAYSSTNSIESICMIIDIVAWTEDVWRERHKERFSFTCIHFLTINKLTIHPFISLFIEVHVPGKIWDIM